MMLLSFIRHIIVRIEWMQWYTLMNRWRLWRLGSGKAFPRSKIIIKKAHWGKLRILLQRKSFRGFSMWFQLRMKIIWSWLSSWIINCTIMNKILYVMQIIWLIISVKILFTPSYKTLDLLIEWMSLFRTQLRFFPTFKFPFC